jgi:beta-mannosidase
VTRTARVAGTRRWPLDAGWELACADAGSTPEDSVALHWKSPIAVPATAASALRSRGEWDFDTPLDFDAKDWWWRLRLTGEIAAAGQVVLGFDGLATLADVWLDGEHILRSENMFLAHELPITLDGNERELLIRCAALNPELSKKRARPRWRVPMLVHTQLRWIRTTLLGRMPGWSPPCPPVGPWRPVWLERRAHAPVNITIDAGIDGDDGIVDVVADLGPGIETATLIVGRDGSRVTASLTRVDGQWRGRARVANPQRWWPRTHGEPARYHVSIEAGGTPGDLAIDLGQCGFRTIDVDRRDGDFAVRVNGVDVFCRGACWTPLDVVSLSATAETYRAAVAQVAAAGMNMLRIGGTMVYEEDAFYDALDEHGILLWQDLMFANMDYPEDESFVAGACAEVDQQLARLRGRPCVALVCGNSEGEQQAAMSGASRDRWSPPLFHEIFAGRVHAASIAYTPSSAHDGAFPHAPNAGTCSYYGVGAYLRPLDDARRSGLRFASECLAFANIPRESGLPGGPALRVHHAAWKARSPRDLGAGWDFDDVRDHYVGLLYGIDPAALRVSDHERYLALGRAATGEVMRRSFEEWRRAGSPTRGALVWFLRDLWPGAGWGLIDAHGLPKPCFHAMRRALAPVALAISDEGSSGLDLHVVNDHADAFDATLALSLYRQGDLRVGHASTVVGVAARSAQTIAAASLFEGFLDLSFSYRFGPPLADVVHATLHRDGALVADAFWFLRGLPSACESDVGLTAALRPGESTDLIVEITTRRFAQSITIDVPGFVASDDGFHLAPGQSREVVLRPVEGTSVPASAKGTIGALNAEATARFALR